MMKHKKTIPLVGSPTSMRTESFKRPDHPDFWDSTDCKKNKFSGVRKNDMGLQWEFWVLGNCEKIVSYATLKRDKYALTKAHVEVFHMTPDDEAFKR